MERDEDGKIGRTQIIQSIYQKSRYHHELNNLTIAIQRFEIATYKKIEEWENFFLKEKNMIVLYNHPVLSLAEQKDIRFF